ncbi:MAG: sensor histidine kinase [Solirubrobacteraceae bacterium]
MDGFPRRLHTDRLARSLCRYRIELLWAAFAIANFAAMIAWPSWRLVPFQLVWLSLTILYGFRVWPMRLTLVVLVCVMAATALAVGFDSMHDVKVWAKLYPLMAALFLAMVWHARRRAEAQQVAEQRADDQYSLLERQERFINDASHELRTPLTIARGHLELLGERPYEVDVALDELGRIDAIIDRLLVLATVEQPDFVRRSQVELEPALEEIFMRWSEVAPRAWRLGAVASGALQVDADCLRTALDALLENAVKYTEPYAAIELRARPAPPGGVLIEVEDEGCGVPPEALARIFDRFARADSARTRAADGVGLGLAMVDAIAKAHGGKCEVTSTESGATFALWLPDFTPTTPAPAPWTLTWPHPHPAH